MASSGSSSVSIRATSSVSSSEINAVPGSSLSSGASSFRRTIFPLHRQFGFASLPKKEQREKINAWVPKQQEESQTRSFSLNFFNFVNYHFDFATQKRARLGKKDAWLKQKLEEVGFKIGNKKDELAGEEFTKLRELYKALNNLVIRRGCDAVLPDLRKNWHTINPDTILKVDGKTTFNASHITTIDDLQGKEVSVIASMMIDTKKPKQVEAFAELMIREGEKGRQLVVVNLTEEEEGSSYMPLDPHKEKIQFGHSTPSCLPCFSQAKSNFKKPYFFTQLIQHMGVEQASVKEDEASGSKFCSIKIKNNEEEDISHRHITFLSSPLKDHQAIGYAKLKNLVSKIKDLLIQKDEGTKEQTCWIHCKQGMGRTSQVAIALMMEAELEEDETAEDLLVRTVWKFCAARRFFAVNEQGFIALYCYAQQRKKEIADERRKKVEDEWTALEEKINKLKSSHGDFWAMDQNLEGTDQLPEKESFSESASSRSNATVDEAIEKFEEQNLSEPEISSEFNASVSVRNLEEVRQSREQSVYSISLYSEAGGIKNIDYLAGQWSLSTLSPEKHSASENNPVSGFAARMRAFRQGISTLASKEVLLEKPEEISQVNAYQSQNNQNFDSSTKIISEISNSQMAPSLGKLKQTVLVNPRISQDSQNSYSSPEPIDIPGERECEFKDARALFNHGTPHPKLNLNSQ